MLDLGKIVRERELYEIHTLVSLEEGDHAVEGIGLVDGKADYWFLESGTVERRTDSYEFLSRYETTYTQTVPDDTGVWVPLWADRLVDIVERDTNVPSHHVIIPRRAPYPELDRGTVIASIHGTPAEDYWLAATDTFPPTPRSVTIGPYREEYDDENWGPSWVCDYNDGNWVSDLL